MGPAPGARLFVVLLLALAAAGCELCPPEGAYFDVENHTLGAIPANVGFYAGAYVVGPTLVFAIVVIASIDGNVDMTGATWDGVRTICYVTGIGVGAVLGAPFHLLALPFRRGDGAGEAPAETPVETPVEEEHDWDRTPPKVPRDYPWPPKLEP